VIGNSEQVNFFLLAGAAEYFVVEVNFTVLALTKRPQVYFMKSISKLPPFFSASLKILLFKNRNNKVHRI
jgi:hypothetical protein